MYVSTSVALKLKLSPSISMQQNSRVVFLVVRGMKPYMNMRVKLEPLIYIRQPEYWGIEVVGRIRGGIGLPAMAPYTVSTTLAGILGTEGIEVIGATRSEKIEVPPDGKSRFECNEWSAWQGSEPPSLDYESVTILPDGPSRRSDSVTTRTESNIEGAT